MPGISGELSLYNIPEARKKLLARRERWARALGLSPSDHIGRRPLEGLCRPDIEPDRHPRKRAPLYLARQYAKALEATPPFVEAYDPLPSAFAWNLSDFVSGVSFQDYAGRFDFEQLWGARGSWVNIAMPGHWVPDLSIGLRLGWGGVRAHIAQARTRHTGDGRTYLDALDLIAQSAQTFMQNHAEHARILAQTASTRDAKTFRQLAARIETVVEAPPQTFHEATIWLAFFMTLNRTYNGMNVLGRLDLLLWPFFEADIAAGRIHEDEAIFLLQSLLIHDTHFICLGGTDAAGQDASNRLSWLILRAWRGIRGPANIGLRVHEHTPNDLLELALEVLLETGQGTPSLVNDTAIVEGLTAMGMPEEVARTYSYGGCHWWGVPGAQYGLSDGTKINLPASLMAALERMMADGEPGLARLWTLFEEAVGHAFQLVSRSYDIHLTEAGRIYPELFGSLWAHGPVDQARDVFDGALEFNYFLADVMGIANGVDALAALETVVEKQGLFSWKHVWEALQNNFAGHPALQSVLQAAPKFGNDDPYVDGIARRVRALCVDAARAAEPGDGRFRILTGFYSWIAHVGTGAGMGATPDGRAAGQPLAHGANPVEGRARQGLTALAKSLAAIQPQTGASAPLHLEIQPDLFRNADGMDLLMAFVRTYFDLGGTQIIVNFVSRDTLADAIAHPDHHRDLVIRVTGFSAYFVNLDPSLHPEILSRFE